MVLQCINQGKPLLHQETRPQIRSGWVSGGAAAVESAEVLGGYEIEVWVEGGPFKRILHRESNGPE